MLTQILHLVIDTLGSILAYMLLLRFHMQWLRAPFRNPVGELVAGLTNWCVLPVRRFVPGFMGLDLATLLLAWPFTHTELAGRLALVNSEVQAYVEHHDASTSIGQRFEHWQLAAHMGADRPLLGWGGDYEAEKARRVAAGQADPVVLEFTHAHNELMDMFARRGLVGVALLLLYMLVPLWLFWPTPARVRGAAGDAPDPVRLALCLVGILLPLAYVGFGLTQVFFAHNSGHMFYLFMLVIVQGALAGPAAAPEAGLPVGVAAGR